MVAHMTTKERLEKTGWNHPLTSFALAVLEKRGSIVVTILANELGSCSRPTKGVNAYCIVASDVLSCMFQEELLIRHGTRTSQPEKGGYWYEAPKLSPHELRQVEMTN